MLFPFFKIRYSKTEKNVDSERFPYFYFPFWRFDTVVIHFTNLHLVNRDLELVQGWNKVTNSGKHYRE